MNPDTPPSGLQYNKRSLFLLSVIALVTTGIGFSIRGNIASELQVDLFDPVDKLRSAEMVATALGIVFLGFACTIAIGSPLLDYIGMGRLLILSSVCYLVGTGIVIFSRSLQGAVSLYSLVCFGMLIIGIGQGLVETVINPLTASLYTEDKTRRLNTLHAWWPGGIIIGGLLGLAMSRWRLNWQIQMPEMQSSRRFSSEIDADSGEAARQRFKGIPPLLLELLTVWNPSRTQIRLLHPGCASATRTSIEVGPHRPAAVAACCQPVADQEKPARDVGRTVKSSTCRSLVESGTA